MKVDFCSLTAMRFCSQLKFELPDTLPVVKSHGQQLAGASASDKADSVL